jgi:laminin beta 1
LNSICDKKTGDCVCQPGIGGKFCDYCSRGAIGMAPFCQKCGECFENWDEKIYALKLDLMRLEREATERFLEFKETGEKNVYKKFYPEFESLELKFKDIKLILSQDYDNDNINITNMSKNLTLLK